MGKVIVASYCQELNPAQGFCIGRSMETRSPSKPLTASTGQAYQANPSSATSARTQLEQQSESLANRQLGSTSGTLQADAQQRANQFNQLSQAFATSGNGPSTASALLASIGDGHDFASGRQFAVCLGMLPGQHSSAGKQRLGRINRAGNRYLRPLPT